MKSKEIRENKRDTGYKMVRSKDKLLINNKLINLFMSYIFYHYII